MSKFGERLAWPHVRVPNDTGYAIQEIIASGYHWWQDIDYECIRGSVEQVVLYPTVDRLVRDTRGRDKREVTDGVI